MRRELVSDASLCLQQLQQHQTSLGVEEQILRLGEKFLSKQRTQYPDSLSATKSTTVLFPQTPLLSRPTFKRASRSN